MALAGRTALYISVLANLAVARTPRFMHWWTTRAAPSGCLLPLVIETTSLLHLNWSRSGLVDKAYDSDGFRELLQVFGLRACIPPKAGRTSPSSYHRGHYKHRRHVENFFQRIKEKRAISTRYEKLSSRFMALVKLAAICDWLQN